MPKSLVVIPTYNEAENLANITSALFNLDIEGLEILVVDDASPDGTGKIADQLAIQYPQRFHIMHRAGKLGMGSAYVQGFNWAIENGAQYIIHMDADFSHSPSYIPQFLALIPDYDVVVGSRYVKGGRLDERWSWYRRLLSWWANSVWVRVILGTKTKDATAGFKCWTAKALQNIGLDRIRSNGYIFQVEMCYLAERLGYRIKEIPIYFEDRRIGQSKMDTGIKVEAAMRVFDIRSRYRNLHPSNGHVQE
ncbi:MAG: polyprenol monophosphomannose synthase [Anaerolineales bacterium]